MVFLLELVAGLLHVGQLRLLQVELGFQRRLLLQHRLGRLDILASRLFNVFVSSSTARKSELECLSLGGFLGDCLRLQVRLELT